MPPSSIPDGGGGCGGGGPTLGGGEEKGCGGESARFNADDVRAEEVSPRHTHGFCFFLGGGKETGREGSGQEKKKLQKKL